MKAEREIILVGDRVLIAPDSDQNKTPTGLYLPPGVREKEKVQGGYVVKVGPGIPIPMPDDEDDEPWSNKIKEPEYFPLQAEEAITPFFSESLQSRLSLKKKNTSSYPILTFSF